MEVPTFCRKNKKPCNRCGYRVLLGTAEGIRTPDLLVRSQTLYPAELQPQVAPSVDDFDRIPQPIQKSKRIFQKKQKTSKVFCGATPYCSTSCISIIKTASVQETTNKSKDTFHHSITYSYFSLVFSSREHSFFALFPLTSALSEWYHRAIEHHTIELMRRFPL